MTGEHPLVYEIFTRVWLRELGGIGLADVPDAALDALDGYDAVWLMGVWTLGDEGRRISRETAAFREDFDRSLPGWTIGDVVGSPYAVADWKVAPEFGGDAGLAALRDRLRARGIALILDFVPNHVARDGVLARTRPECFVHEADGSLACGRDPHFPPWPDTAQLDYRREATQQAAVDALIGIADRCDGVRCDMAMLVLDDVFRRTFAGFPTAGPDAPGEFWPRAIDAVRARHPGFVFVAEAYWDLEYRLLLLGFDYTYDKRLYDRLRARDAAGVRGHLGGSVEFLAHSLHFVENHDEERAAVAFGDAQRAATVTALTSPGLRLVHDGQGEGRRLRANVHLGRRADEPVDAGSAAFHRRLVDILRHPALRDGRFAALRAEGALVAHRWQAPGSEGSLGPAARSAIGQGLPQGAGPVAARSPGSIVVVANLGTTHAEGHVPLDLRGIAGRAVVLEDLLTGDRYDRDGDALVDPARGLYVALGGYGVHVFEVTAHVRPTGP
jgi:hypothetical protein